MCCGGGDARDQKKVNTGAKMNGIRLIFSRLDMHGVHNYDVHRLRACETCLAISLDSNSFSLDRGDGANGLLGFHYNSSLVYPSTTIIVFW